MAKPWGFYRVVVGGDWVLLATWRGRLYNGLTEPNHGICLALGIPTVRPVTLQDRQVCRTHQMTRSGP